MSDHDTVYQQRIIEAKLRDSMTPGFVTVFTELQAKMLGAFDEDAIDFETAMSSALDADDWEAL